MIHTADKRFALLHDVAQRHHAQRAEGPAGHTLIFSASDGKQRALVRHFSAPTFEDAWRLGLPRFKKRMQQNKIAGEHLRVDWVETSVSVSWEKFQQLLSSVKRTYFRFGLAFDASLTHLLTEVECHANAVYYGGSEHATGWFNAKNFAHYAAKRFSTPVVPPSDPETTVWVVSTAGAYCGPDGVTHELPGLLPAEYGLLSRGLYTGHREIPRLTPEFLRHTVGAASRWLARQVLPDGKFIYGYFPCFGREIGSYNSLRHLSSLYSLLDVVDFTTDRSLIVPAARGLAFAAARLIRTYEPEPGRRMAFVVEEPAREIKLGANGAALLAYAKYRELTGSEEYNELTELLAEGIAYLQDPATGLFTHVLDSETLAVKEKFRIIYYDGEAVFGLMRLYARDGNRRWFDLARAGFEHFLTSEKHITAHDHWLSYAASEMCIHTTDERYIAFGINNCMQYLDFILRRETTYPTLLELMMAARKLLLRARELELDHLLEKVDANMFRRALHYRAHFLLNGFFWPEMAMFYKYPHQIEDAFFIRHQAFRARIDDTQHYLSGLAAYGSMLVENDPFWAAPQDARGMGARFFRPPAQG